MNHSLKAEKCSTMARIVFELWEKINMFYRIGIKAYARYKIPQGPLSNVSIKIKMGPIPKK